MGSCTLDVLPQPTEGSQKRNYTSTNEHSKMKGQSREEYAHSTGVKTSINPKTAFPFLSLISFSAVLLNYQWQFPACTFISTVLFTLWRLTQIRRCISQTNDNVLEDKTATNYSIEQTACSVYIVLGLSTNINCTTTTTTTITTTTTTTTTTTITSTTTTTTTTTTTNTTSLQCITVAERTVKSCNIQEINSSLAI